MRASSSRSAGLSMREESLAWAWAEAIPAPVEIRAAIEAHRSRRSGVRVCMSAPAGIAWRRVGCRLVTVRTRTIADQGILLLVWRGTRGGRCAFHDAVSGLCDAV